MSFHLQFLTVAHFSFSQALYPHALQGLARPGLALFGIVISSDVLRLRRSWQHRTRGTHHMLLLTEVHNVCSLHVHIATAYVIILNTERFNILK